MQRAHEFLPPKSPRPKQAGRWHIGKKDLVSIYGTTCKCIEASKAGYRFVRADDPKAEPFSATVEQFDDLRELQSFGIQRDVDPEKAFALLEAPAKSLMDLTKEERRYVLWKARACEKFLCMCAQGRASKYGPMMAAALDIIQRELDDEYRLVKQNGKQRRGGRQPCATYKLVKVDQFREWLKRYLEGGSLNLCDRYHQCGINHSPYYTAEEYAILIEYAWKYATLERPTISRLWGDMDEEITAKNVERRRKGLPT